MKKKETPAERGRRLQNERAARAQALWMKAKTRLKRAKTLERKWRLKAAYYKRVISERNSAEVQGKPPPPPPPLPKGISQKELACFDVEEE